MRRIIYISTFIPRHKREAVLNSLNLFDNNAADTLSYAIYNGLKECDNFEFLTINVSPIGPYPKCSKKACYDGETFWDQNNKVIDLSFSTIYLHQHYSIYTSCKRTLRSVLNKDDEFVFIVYSINLSILKSLIYFKKRGYKIKIVLIIPDFWDDMLSGSSLKSCIKSLVIPNVQDMYNYCDGFVLLTKQMNEKINVTRPYCVVEGMYDSKESRPDPVLKNHPTRTFFYSGMLHEKFGVTQLVNAFHMIANPDIRLKLCGSGDATNDIIELSKRDNRIEYLGLLNREEVLKEQHNADFLVNPRTSDGMFTKYSFPSKTIEYFVSGTPAIIHKLPGIPEE